MNFDLTPGLDAYGHLWMAVLRQAVDDATVPAQCRDHRKERGAARDWLKSDELTVGAVRWICRILNLDVEAVRHEYTRRIRHGAPRRKRVNTAGYLHQ